MNQQTDNSGDSRNKAEMRSTKWFDKRLAFSLVRDGFNQPQVGPVHNYVEIEQKLLGTSVHPEMMVALRDPEVTDIRLTQGAFAVHMTNAELLLLAATVKLCGHYGKTVVIGPLDNGKGGWI